MTATSKTVTSTAPAIAIELAHLYAPERLIPCRGFENWSSDVVTESLTRHDALASDILHHCALPSARVERVALLDDLAVREEQRSSGERWRWELFLHASRQSLVIGAGARVFDESRFVPRGRELQEEIVQASAARGVPLLDGRVTLATSMGPVSVRVSGFAGITELLHPSCAVLDLAWCEWRSSRYETVLTALPASFFRQQLQVAALSALLQIPGRERLRTVFLRADGSISRELAYGELNLL